MTYKEIIENQLPPKLYKEDANIHSAEIRIIGKQLDDIQMAIDEILKEFTIQTTSEYGIVLHERTYGIKTIDSQTLDERRNNVIAKARGGQGTTVEQIKLSALAYGYEIDVIEEFNNYTFIIEFTDIKGIPPNLEDLKNVINQIKPAHLNVEFKFTYTLWSEVKNITWADVKTGTWGELKTRLIV